MNRQIAEYGMHGIDCTDEAKMGTSFYKDWIGKEQKEKDKKTFEKIMNNRKKRTLESEIKRVKDAGSKIRA